MENGKSSVGAVSRGKRFNGSRMSFPVPAPPSAEKLRGSYYTPAPIASYLARWVGEAGQKLLEPSCGDGAILAPLAELGGRVVGVELEPAEVEKARVAAPPLPFAADAPAEHAGS